MKALATNLNKAGKKFALVTDGAAFWVMGRSVNYSRGKDVVTWAKCHPNTRVNNREFQIFAKTGMTKMAATALYEKKIAGKQKH
ncbi:MAG: hypothetical protein GY746_07495 [Gammaproteobacteria bacterium]|nr:hypothetical protein [Gammaproteobacteria bacterium]